ncbi:HAD family hydrolase [Actinopolymorpha sp. B17G11]|uniref:HAD family hydrolase n=1 Tax=unclassified Actinopolymorpha TaxID=2627063 RepID=UPI0032D93251
MPFVFFDGDQTLWDFTSVMRHALAIALRELRTRRPGAATDQLTVETLIADRDAVATEHRHVGWTMDEIRWEAFDRTVRRCGPQDPDLARDLYELFMRHRFDDIELYPDVVPTLDALAASSYRLGLLTNGNGDPERCGLAGRFEAVVLAQDHGVSKPDRRLYDIAAAAAGDLTTAPVMVGDSLYSDVVGAQCAGWRGVWLNRCGETAPRGITPHAEITSLAHLPVALEWAMAVT